MSVEERKVSKLKHLWFFILHVRFRFIPMRFLFISIALPSQRVVSRALHCTHSTPYEFVKFIFRITYKIENDEKNERKTLRRKREEPASVRASFFKRMNVPFYNKLLCLPILQFDSSFWQTSFIILWRTTSCKEQTYEILENVEKIKIYRVCVRFVERYVNDVIH